MTHVLVAGAGGLLGQDVVAEALRRGYSVSALTRAQLDITDPDAVTGAMVAAAPQLVVNCAAWTNVDGAQEHETQALAVNGIGAGNLAQAAAGIGAAFVHVSTDYVFDGTATVPYLESDPTGPQSAYGRTKLVGEELVLVAGGAVVRAAWLFGVGGGNFVATMLKLAAERDEVAVVTDQVGCPTFTGHLAPALLDIGERHGSGIYHVAPRDHCSWHDFAVAIFRQAGVSCSVAQASSAQMARPAPRPPWSVLGTERADAIVLASWQDGLDAYLAQRKEGVVS